MERSAPHTFGTPPGRSGGAITTYRQLSLDFTASRALLGPPVSRLRVSGGGLCFSAA